MLKISNKKFRVQLFKSLNRMFFIMVLTWSTGCSMFDSVSSGRKTVNEGQPRKKEAKWVSKAQYDDLKAKYEKLLNKSRQHNLQSSGETVDVFDGLKDQKKPMNTPTASVQKKAPLAIKLDTKNKSEGDIVYEFKQKVAQVQESSNVDVMNLMKPYLTASVDQVRVRAIFFTARHYHAKEQYDLCLQLAERVINSEAFSSYLLDSLRLAVDSAKALNLEEKMVKYQSLYIDVFNQA